MKTFFVSSTFKDMNYERDAIREITLPKLNAIAKKYGQSVSFCDLRWGIDTSLMSEEDSSKKVLRVCLDEIDRCRPPLVIIIGERYGWIPPKDLVKSVAEYKRLLIDDYEKSVTALEIEYGALCEPRRNESTLVYLREIENAPSDYLCEDEEHSKKLSELKSRLYSLTNGKVRTYKAKFNGNILEGVDDFANMLASDLTDIMLPQWEIEASLSPFQLERRIQWNYIEEKSRFFKGRNALLDSIIDEIDKGKRFKFLKGDTGCGKSTLFSAIAVKLRQLGWDVLPFIGGYTLESNDADDIINNTIYYLESALGKPHAEPSSQANEGSEKKLEEKQKRMAELCFEYAKTGKRLMIMVDSVENLFPNETRDKLRFIPENLGDNVRFLLTANSSFKTVGVEYDTLGVLSTEEISDVISGMLERTGRELDKDVRADIQNMVSSFNPLYLSLLIQRLLMMDKDDFFEIRRMGDGMGAISLRQRQLIASCPNDTDSLCSALISEAGARINPTLIDKITKYIAFSRFGLRESDLQALIGDQWSALDFAHFLSYMGDSFLMRNDGRFDFSHQSIRRGIVSSVADGLPFHCEIFEHLNGLSEDDVVRLSEILYHGIKAGKRDFVISFTTRHLKDNFLKTSDIDMRLESKTVYDIIRTDGIEWLMDIIEYCKENESADKFSCFISVFIASKMLQKQDDIASAVGIQGANLSLSLKIAEDGSDRSTAIRIFADTVHSMCLLLFDAKNNFTIIENSISTGLSTSRALFEKAPTDENRCLLLTMLYVASSYYGGLGVREQTVRAIELCKEQAELTCDGDEGGGLFTASSLSRDLTLAQLYLNLNDKESLKNALSYAAAAKELAEGDSTSNTAIIGANALLGNVYLAIGGKENVEKALDVYKKVYLNMRSVYSRSGEVSDLNDLLIARNNYVKALLDSGMAGAYGEALTEALENIRAAERVASDLGTVASLRPLVLFYMNAGTIYQNLGGVSNTVSALENYKKAERVSDAIAKKISQSGATIELATQKIMIARAYSTVNLGDNAENALRLINEAIDVLEGVRLEKPDDQSLESIESGAYNMAAIILVNKAMVSTDGNRDIRPAIESARKAIECAMRMKDSDTNGWEQALATAYNNMGLVYRTVYITNAQLEAVFLANVGSRETMDGIFIKAADGIDDELALISTVTAEDIQSIEENSFSNRILPILIDEEMSEEEKHRELDKISDEGDKNAERAKDIKDAARKKALEYMTMALDIMEKLTNKLATLECYSNISIIYQNVSELYLYGETEENILSAISYQRRAEEIAEHIHTLTGSLMTDFAVIKSKVALLQSYFTLEDGNSIVKEAYSTVARCESLYKKWPFAELKMNMLTAYHIFSQTCSTLDARPDPNEATALFEGFISILKTDYENKEEFEANAYAMTLASYAMYIRDSGAGSLEYAAELAKRGYEACLYDNMDLTAMTVAMQNLFTLRFIYSDMGVESSEEYCTALEDLIDICFKADEYANDYDITEDEGEKASRHEIIFDCVTELFANPYLDTEKGRDYIVSAYPLAKHILDGYDEEQKGMAEEFMKFAEATLPLLPGGADALYELQNEDSYLNGEYEDGDGDGNAEYEDEEYSETDPSALFGEDDLTALLGDENALASLFGGIDPSLLMGEDDPDTELDEDALKQLFGGAFPFNDGEDDE